MAVQDSVLFGCCLSVRPPNVRVSQSTPFGTALASISRAYYQRFAASSTVTPLETILPVVGSIPNSGVSGENESVGEKFCQPFTLSSQLIVSTRKQSGQPTLLACRRLNRSPGGQTLVFQSSRSRNCPFSSHPASKSLGAYAGVVCTVAPGIAPHSLVCRCAGAAWSPLNCRYNSPV
jgi:hypothetical protein